VTTRLAIAVALLMLAAPLASTVAQPGKKMPSIGYLSLRVPSDLSFRRAGDSVHPGEWHVLLAARIPLISDHGRFVARLFRWDH
jgi:hypothetical protein